MEAREAVLAWATHASLGRNWTAIHRDKVQRVVVLFCSTWNSREVASLGQKDVDLVRQVVEDRSAAYQNFVRVYCRAFFRWARTEGLTEKEPERGWKTAREVVNEEKYHFYPVEEQRRIVAATRPDLRVFFKFCFVTGLRQSTARRLKWKMLGREGLLRVPPAEVKTRKGLRFLLPAELMTLLGPRGLPEENVFPGLPVWKQEIWREFRKACRSAGVAVGSPHDMRRSFASQLAANGVPMTTIMRIGGWQTTAVLEKYYVLGVPDRDVQEILGGLV